MCFVFLVRLDVYRKIPKDLTEPTLTGAVSKLKPDVYYFVNMLQCIVNTLNMKCEGK